MGSTDERSDQNDRPARSGAADGQARPGSAQPPHERRSIDDRRMRFDRREMIRFESDRRAGFDRRADVDPWARLESPLE